MNWPAPRTSGTSSPVPPSNGVPSIEPSNRQRDAIAILRAFGLGDERPILLGDRLQGLIDLGVGHLSRQPRELDSLEIGERDRRHDLELDRVGKIGLAFDDALDRALVGRQHDLRLGRELESVIGDDLAVGFTHRRLDHFRHGGFAVEALEVRNRNSSRAEAPQLHAALQIVEALIDLRLKVACGHDDAIFALEARGGSFSHLHRHCSSRREIERGPSGSFAKEPPGWCGRRGSNPHDFRHGNLNPARLPIPPRPRQEGGPAARLISCRRRRAL